MLSCYLFVFFCMCVCIIRTEIYINLYIYIYFLYVIFYSYICVIWPVEVTICEVGLFYNLSVRRMFFFLFSLLFSLFYIFLCVCVFSACKFLVFFSLSLFKVHDCNREKENKKKNQENFINIFYLLICILLRTNFLYHGIKSKNIFCFKIY
jgi:hypothetical protein